MNDCNLLGESPRARRRPVRGCLWLLALAAMPAANLPAQEPSGLQAAESLERALVEAIAGAEKSVVSIARVHKSEPAKAASPALRPDPFRRGPLGPVPQNAPVQPTDPDFIPNEFGTGVVVGAAGSILTNYHVLGENSDYYVTTSNRKVYKAEIKAADPRSDLAVLQINADSLVPIRFGRAETLRKGQIVIALGNPYAIARDGQASASWGIVSNLGRKAGPDPDAAAGTSKNTLHHFGTLIQTDAKLNLGTSGGALLNLKGEMVGLTTSLAATAGFEQAAGYAIPVDDTFKRIVDTLKLGREVEYGLLGIRPLNLEQDEVLAGRRGARIEGIEPGTPAEKSGLKVNDIVTAVNGEPIHDADGLVLNVSKLPVESVARLSVERPDRTVQVEVTLAKYPVRGKKIVTSPGASWRGLRIDYSKAVVDPELVARASATYGEGAVIVVEVERGSPAWNGGLRPGMLVTHVGRAAVDTPKAFWAAVAGKTGPVELRMIAAPGERPTVTVGKE
ncbi:MAG: trypsin-like peptidase domain-containing protein [Pirellulales bacterium]